MSIHTQTGTDYYLFIGTYSPAEDKGIFIYRFNTASGKAVFLNAISGIENPSFLTLSPDHQHFYAVSETRHHKDGHVFAYSFNKDKGTSAYINKQLSDGDDPCNIITDTTGQWLFVANYASGSLSALPVKADGSADKISQNIPHHGHSINPDRQAEAHVHASVMTPDNQRLFVTDLGMDKIFLYAFNEKTGRLDPGNPPFTEVIPGSGPRVMEFSPNGKFLYLIHEMGGQITVFEYLSGKLTPVQVISNLPEKYKGKIWAADIHLSPDGKFLYATNREDLNDIVTYAVHPDSGKLTAVDRQPTGGKTPRNFTLSPDGRYVLAGHENSNEITVFRRDEKTGMLTLTEEHIPVAHAVCLKMVPAH